MKTYPVCNQVDSTDCKAPPSFGGEYVRVGTCYRCGLPVCTNCSLRVRYLRYGQRRLCHNCLDEIDREAGIPRDQRRAHRHLLRLAGYKA
jgi:hypothetical protein